MKILIITSSPTPQNKTSSIFIHNRLKTLKSLNVDFDTVSPVFEIKKHLNIASKLITGYNDVCKYPDSLDFEGINYQFLKQKYGLFLYTLSHSFNIYPEIYKKFEKMIFRKYDLSQYSLIHAHFALPNGLLAKNIFQKYHIPYIVTLHGSDIHTFPFKNPRLKRKIIETLENAKKCFFVSKALKKKAIEIGYTKNNSVVIPNGFDKKTFFYQDKNKAKLKLGFFKKRLIGFVGHLLMIKNVLLLPEIFMEVLKRYKDTDFVIIGDGILRRQLQKSFEEKEVNVTFTGTISPQKVANYMRAMDILILPSKNEGWPCVIKEAQACGCYVIGSNNGGIPEAIGDYGSVYPTKGDFINLAKEKIIELFNNPHFLLKTPENLERFHWDNIVKKEIGFYYNN